MNIQKYNRETGEIETVHETDRVLFIETRSGTYTIREVVTANNQWLMEVASEHHTMEIQPRAANSVWVKEAR